MKPESLDEVLIALADQRRRRLLVSMLKHPQEVGRVDVQEDVAMYHVHLPKLEAADLIRWERDEWTASEGPRFEEIEPLLEYIDEHVDEIHVE